MEYTWQGVCLILLKSEESVLCYAVPPRDKSLESEHLDAPQKRCTAKHKIRELHFTNSYKISPTAIKQYYWKDTVIVKAGLH